nr:MAG TPA: hypothetical protein [Bacteriophage sp.]
MQPADQYCIQTLYWPNYSNLCIPILTLNTNPAHSTLVLQISDILDIYSKRSVNVDWDVY